MGEWTETRVADIAVDRGLVGGPFGSSLGSKDYVPTGVPVIRGSNLGSDGRFQAKDFVFVTPEKVNRELSRNTAEPGDIVVTQRGTLGQVGIVPDSPYPRYVISQSQMRLRIDKNRADVNYVYYSFRSPVMVDAIYKHAIATGVPHINLGILANLTLSLPPVSVQRVIAVVLGALDDKIAVNERLLDSATEFCATLFRQTFSAALEHVAVGSELPPEWFSMQFGDAVSCLETGRRPKGGVSSYTTGVPSVGAESIVQLARFDFSKVKYVPREFFDRMTKGVLSSHDILLYKDGGRPGNFEPHVSMFGNGFPFERACINEHVYRIRMSEPFRQSYGLFWLSSPPLMDEMRRRGTGVAVPGLNSTAVKELPIVRPPANELRRFESTADPLIDSALNAARESQLLAQLRDMLLPKLMSGELRVRDAERVVEDAT